MGALFALKTVSVTLLRFSPLMSLLAWATELMACPSMLCTSSPTLQQRHALSYDLVQSLDVRTPSTTTTSHVCGELTLCCRIRLQALPQQQQ